MAVVAGFVLIACHPRFENTVLSYIIFAVGGILGITMIFSAFRSLYSNTRLLPLTSCLSPLKYIGTRTLDIYLLHYFVLPRFLLLHKEQLLICDSRIWEFLVAMVLALFVIAICLLASYIIRLSPFLGHYLFGVKYERRK